MAAAVRSPFVVCCESALTVANAPSLRVEILEALKDHEAVVVHIPALCNFDLTFVQMLVSAYRTAHSNGRMLTVHAGDGHAVLERLLAAGLHSNELPPWGELPVSIRDDNTVVTTGDLQEGDLDTAALASLVKEIGSAAVDASLDVFFAEMNDRIAVLRRLSVDADRSNIRREAHSVKGTAGIFGLRRLSEEGAALERSSDAITGSSYLAMLDRLEVAYQRAREALKAAPMLAA